MQSGLRRVSVKDGSVRSAAQSSHAFLSPSALSRGGIVIKDVAGDLYHVADPGGLDDRSRKWLWAFVD